MCYAYQKGNHGKPKERTFAIRPGRCFTLPAATGAHAPAANPMFRLVAELLTVIPASGEKNFVDVYSQKLSNR